MSLFDILYTIIIGPLKLLFEVIYTLAYYMCNSAGLSIIALSLVMNFLVLPLYKKADAMQEEENKIEAKLKPGVDHIKKTFKGDERYMMLQTYYRQNNYKPTDALKGSLSLLLEIPFFMAAYGFLSNLQVMKHASFGPISNLGAPDTLLTIGSISLHLLPILMTLINIISALIYTKGSPAKAKIQLFAMAFIFLVFLYDSPSGLVFYWTLNNLFSLVKNIFYKLKNPRKVLTISSFIIGLLSLVFFTLIRRMPTFNQEALVIVISLCLMIPMVMGKVWKGNINFFISIENSTFIKAQILCVTLLGLYIPSQLIKSSPIEFLNTTTLYNPSNYVGYSFCLALGLFGLWFSVFYYLMDGQSKSVFSFLVLVLSICLMIDYFGFGNNTSQLALSLRFDNELQSSSLDVVKNLGILFVCLVILITLTKFKQSILNFLLTPIVVVLILLSSINVFSINGQIKEHINVLNENTIDNISLNLSKDKNNVIVMILDRAINDFFPYALNEIDELERQFDGFTYYPNTLSYGRVTKIGIPSLFGGYEYTPTNINNDKSRSLKEKIYESFKVMPVLFNENGYDVTFFDPTLGAGTDILSDYEDIDVYHSVGSIKSEDYKDIVDINYENLKRNIFMYSLVKGMPLAIQPIIYNSGAYNDIDNYNRLFSNNLSISSGSKKSFIDNISVLKELPNFTNIGSQNKTFTILYNECTHEDTLVNELTWEADDYINNSDFDDLHEIRTSIYGDEIVLENYHMMQHYQVNVASYKQLGIFFDYLRAQGVYDNTKIIIVSDHGNNLEDYKVNVLPGEEDTVMAFNPLLLVKDYNAKGINLDYTLMTNADVPIIATKGDIDNPINPFSGNELRNNSKEGIQYILSSGENNNPEDNRSEYANVTWYSFEGDSIKDINNWKLLSN